MEKRKKGILLTVCLLFIFAFPVLSKAENLNLRVIAEKTNIRSKPDLNQFFSISRNRFEIKLWGGLNYLSGYDLNHFFKSNNDLWNDYAVVDKEFEYIHSGIDCGGEFIVNLTNKIGLGVGTGFIHTSKNSTAKFAILDVPYEFTAEPKISVVPITFNVYYCLPVGNFVSVTANSGVGYYLGTINWAWSYNIPPSVFYWEKCKPKSNAFGFHGCLGLEFNFTSTIAFLIEGIGRYVKLKGLTGDLMYERTEPGYKNYGTRKDVTLWYYESTNPSTGETYPFVAFSDKKPSHSSLSNIREAEFNLSGFSLRAGIKFKF